MLDVEVDALLGRAHERTTLVWISRRRSFFLPSTAAFLCRESYSRMGRLGFLFACSGVED